MYSQEELDQLIANARAAVAAKETGIPVPSEFDVPRPPMQRRGVIESIGRGIKAGVETLWEEPQAGFEEAKAGAHELIGKPLITGEPTTFLDRLRGAYQMVAGAARIPFTPLTAIGEAAGEAVASKFEFPDEERSPELARARALTSIGTQLAVPGVLGRLRGMGEPPSPAVPERLALPPMPPVEGVPPSVANRLPSGPRPPLALPELGVGPEPERMFEVGPPRSVTGKPRLMVEPALRGEGGRIVRGPREVRPGVGETGVVEPGGFGPRGKFAGESSLEALRRRVQEEIAGGEAKLPEEGSLGRELRARLRAARGEEPPPPTPSVPNAERLSLRDRVKLSAEGEAAKVEAAKTIPDDELITAPQHVQNAVNANRAAESASWPRWMTGLGQRFKFAPYYREVWSAPQMAKGDPILEEIVGNFLRDERKINHLAGKWTDEVDAIVKEFGEDVFAQAAKARDLKLAPRDPQVVQAMNRLGKAFDEAALANSLDPQHPNFIASYFPRLRQSFKLERTRIIPVEEYMPEDITRVIPSQLRPSYTKTRKIELPADRYDPDYVKAYFKSAARGSVYGTPIHHGSLQDLKYIVAKLKDRPEAVQDWVANYINYQIGAPGTRSAEWMEKAAHAARSMEFTRTIGGNIMTPIYNTFQRALTFSEVTPKSFIQAFKDELDFYRGNERLVNLIKKAGLDIRGYGEKAALNDAQLTGLEQAWQKAVDAGAKVRDFMGIPFAKSEQGNRLHAFFAGYRDAIGRGLSEEAAIERAAQLVERTQFTGGKAARSGMLRGPVGGTLGQFSQFKIRMAEYMFNNAAGMAKALFSKGLSQQERLDAASKFVKFWGAQYALGGPQSLPILSDVLDKYDPIQWKGALPMLGIAVSNQLALGALDLTDAKSLARQIPGPLVNHALDLARAAGLDQWASAIASTATGGQFQPSTLPAEPAERAKLLTRAIPVAGVQLERLRRGSLFEGDTEREPQNLSQAFGMEPIPRTQPVVQRMEGTTPVQQILGARLSRSLGILDPVQEAAYRETGQRRYAAARRNQVMQQATQLRASGNYAEANVLIRDMEAELGLVPGSQKISSQGVKAVRERARMTPLEYLRKQQRRSLRGYGGESETLE